VSFAAITIFVASQRVFIVVSVYFVTIQSGNFWIHPRITFLNVPVLEGLNGRGLSAPRFCGHF
jgi:hypothetical protein